MIESIQGTTGAQNLFPRAPGNVEEEGGPSFARLLENEIGDVNKKQIEAEQLMEKFLAGEDVSIEKVLTTARKAELMFKTLLEIRNKLTESFDELMRIQV